MATRLRLLYDGSDEKQVRGVEALAGVPAGVDAEVVMVEEVLACLHDAEAHAEAERLLAHALQAPAGDVFRLRSEGFGRLSDAAARVIDRLGFIPTLGSTHDPVQAAAIVAAHTGSLERARIVWEHRLGVTWGRGGSPLPHWAHHVADREEGSPAPGIGDGKEGQTCQCQTC